MLHLEPESSADAPILPEKNSDIVREADTVVDVNEPLQIPDKAITVMRIKTGHFTVNVSINTMRKADRLVVTLQGARGGGKDTTNSRRPMFGRRNWDGLYECPILAISDPQTEMEWDSHLPRVGMYIGTFQHDLVPELNHMIDKFCEALGIPLGRVVIYGSSSGGTSALLVAARRPHPTQVIAVVPFLRPDKYREEVVAITARAAGGSLDDWNKGIIEEPWRYNPVVAMRDAISAGRDLRVLVAQNTRDKVTVNRHFPGLWRRFDIDPEGGVSPDGRVMAVLFDSPEAGHGHEPADYSRPLVKLAYEFFDRPLPTKERSGKKKEKKEKPVKPAAMAE
jgi:pimeloyl-ACP methyl ester carboxylesterase